MAAGAAVRARYTQRPAPAQRRVATEQTKKMTGTNAHEDDPKAPRTLEQILTVLDRTSELMAQNEARAARQTAETARQTAEIREQMKETDRRLRKAEELFTSQWGKLMESLVEGDLVSLLRERGVAVDETSQRLTGRRNGEHTEFDILAANGAEVVVVEVKTTLRPEDVTDFLSKLAWFTDWFPTYRERPIYGAVAYLKSDSSVTRHAERQGLFVIRATGNSASIVNEPDFKPRAFT